MQNLPIEIVNKILCYKTELEDQLWIPHYTHRHRLTYRINKYSTKLETLRKCMMNKVEYPMPVRYSYYGDGYHATIFLFHIRFSLIFSYILSRIYASAPA